MGLLMVYTGNGKGKTTAALGQVFRALGRGWRCCVIQFIKADKTTGEALFAAKQEGLDFLTLGQGFVLPGENPELHRKAAREAWDKAAGILASGAYNLVVLDELTWLLSLGFLEIKELLAALDRRPANMNIVITGRGAPAALVEKACLVTEMARIKHPLDSGAGAQEGIEY